jgi:2-oxo-hept-3-ene-1,7-dioate hydratase
MQAALEDMTVRVTDAEGTEIGSAGGDAVLGHPVNSLLWLVGEGVALKAGDLVSVGSIGALMPPAKAGGKATVTYEGLPGDPSVSVTFR